jgi:hypothetical protein
MSLPRPESRAGAALRGEVHGPYRAVPAPQPDLQLAQATGICRDQLIDTGGFEGVRPRVEDAAAVAR